jgi:NADPH2:quinone reductase
MSSNTSMQAVEIQSFGGPDVLRMTVRPRPVHELGEVLIEVSASGVNRPDVLQRKGLYAPPPGASDIPGLEVAGRIVSGDAEAMASSPATGCVPCWLVVGTRNGAWYPWSSVSLCLRVGQM